jgi:acylglycerol lipase
LFIIHGLGEHSGRWHHLALSFAKRNFAVFIHDHEGHGRTPSPKKIKEYFDRITPLLEDCIDHIRHNQESHSEIKEVPCFLLGHSMGGAIAIRIAMMQSQLFHGVIISAPAMGMLPGSNKFLYLTSKYVKNTEYLVIRLIHKLH